MVDLWICYTNTQLINVFYSGSFYLKMLSQSVCLRPFNVKASSVWISRIAREFINNVVLKTFFPLPCPLLLL